MEIQLAKLQTLRTPSLGLEQYPVSPEAASELLYMAGFEHDDLEGRIIDLGTGTGRLAIGASLMGANEIVGLDVDKNSVKIAMQNADGAGADVDWIVGDVDSVMGGFQTVLMNPPYGTRTPHLDTRFLTKAFELAHVSYSIHKSSTRKFLLEFARKNGRKVDTVRSLEMSIPHQFDFHRQKWKPIEVDLLRISET